MLEAYRAALLERTRERVPLDWAMSQNNLGAALSTLGERESDTARIEAAVAAWEACATITVSVWPPEWIEWVRSCLAAARAEITRRSAGQFRAT